MAIPYHAVASGASGIEFLWAEITEKCNLHCEHCYSDSAPNRPLLGAMSLADWRQAIDEGAALGCSQIQFIGGEPTLHPALPVLIEQARGVAYKFVEVYTNGIHFTPELKDAFVRYHVNLAFSAYSHIPEVHDRITQRQGSFCKTMGSMRWALESGLDVRVGIIEMQANAGHSEDLKRMLGAMGVSNIGVDRMRGIGRGAVKEMEKAPFGELCGQCWRGRLCVTAAGEVYPCVFSRFCRVGSVRAGLSTLLATDGLRGFRENVRLRQNAKRVVGADCEPVTPPQCKPDRPVCSPDLPCSPDNPPEPCAPNNPCTPDCVPSACRPQIA